ncbi:hypothetical protein CALVIDRAFT_547161 [Calocera viscosa TUFC12733]|uniref:Uncharacterized protein n=1 Tax=Calocera viscosa (strain TUFC12733) TaxID=1330018 RepID=A0A167HKX5_CALVF|nr:hypothetical protein CALVIDRAFT_547161 [Calocera viscosa TUFC12733]
MSSNQVERFGSYPNWSAAAFDAHYWADSSGVKSSEDQKRLVRLLTHPRFHMEHLRGVNFQKCREDLRRQFSELDPFRYGPGWHQAPLTLQVPLGKLGVQPYTVDGFFYKPLHLTAKDICENDPHARAFHYTPYKLYWRSTQSNQGPTRVHDDVFSSDAWIAEHEKVQVVSLPEPCNHPRAILGIALWSDATHAAQFGHAKLWPCYMMVLNQSKYQHCRPSFKACHHVAHFPELPDALRDDISKWGGPKTSSALFAHCKRELFHEGWRQILGADFREAYRHGMIVHCKDGMTRRLFPRIFFYSADYPEKTLIATIRDMGLCPCPRCLLPLKRVGHMGMPRDRQFRTQHVRVDTHGRRFDIAQARVNILQGGFVVGTSRNDSLLKIHSWVETENAFSVLADFGFNIFSTLAVDLMHEFELGVWKRMLMHLLRILHSCSEEHVTRFNHRFRRIPKFGRHAIRGWTSDVSELKKLAARDYEDILQCIIPAIDGLLPEPHNSSVCKLLFLMAQWHGLAKLRLHTSATLDLLDHSTTILGVQVRHFATKTCDAFQTVELEKEARARKRRAEAQSSTRKPTVYSLRTYKWHALGDYVSTIRALGPTDGFSTELQFYRRTNKRSFVKQVTKLEDVEGRLGRLGLGDVTSKPPPTDEEPGIEPDQDRRAHYKLSVRSELTESLATWLLKHTGDGAVKDFRSRLLRHLYARLVDLDLYDDIPDSHQKSFQSLVLVGDQLHWHKTMRLRYTTYDLQRAEDYVNPSTDHSYVMMLSGVQGDTHPYWYAQVLRLFHVNIVCSALNILDPKRMDVLFVRWFGADPDSTYAAGWDTFQLDRIGFVEESDPDAFGFVDPLWVMRTVHVCPVFAEETHSQFREAFAAVPVEEELDGDVADSTAVAVGVFVAPADDDLLGDSDESDLPPEEGDDLEDDGDILD